MPSSSFKPVKLHQCVFGYDDGHRLLASSHRLSTDASSLLLLLSDLAPGLTTTGLEGYWTGVPVTSAKLYALMRTWPAPEMPRPGCVWTHVVLISFADIARFANLQAITGQFSRPDASEEFDRYAIPLDVDPEIKAGDIVEAGQKVEISDALRLVDALYSGSRKSNLPAPAGKLDAAIFGIWSQQWPRLRRSFSFRTAGGGSEASAQNFRFDIKTQTLSDLRTSDHRFDVGAMGEPWAQVAAEDVCSTGSTDFRRFIWRYGSDVRHGRDRFRFLADLYLNSRRKTYIYGELSSTLARVSAELPMLEDGKLLKQDLVTGDNRYSLLPSGDTIEKLEFFVTHPDNEALPALPPEATRVVQDVWADRADHIIAIADRAIESRSALGEALLDRLAAIAKPATFLAATRERPGLRRRLVSVNPELLDTDDLLEVSPPERLSLIELLPDDAPVTARLLDRLTVLDDLPLAQSMLRRFPEQTMRSVAARVEARETQGGSPIPGAWASVVARQASTFIEIGFIQKARSTRVLAAFAALLGHTNDPVLRAGPVPWATALKEATDDVRGSDRQMFLAFLLSLALAKPMKGSEILFVRAFEPIHTALWRSELPYEAQSMLSSYLANLFWWEQWDTCLRLRIATVNAFVHGDLDPGSFRDLTKDQRLREQLFKIADDSKKGRRLIKHGVA
ncbi:GAP1-N1 domain-containing protein [Methylobacterium iners]|uniref:Uncharacterized protein n=1 Tax=Methylobacterium iners TaxID=418707 RepID=A0ABQ4S7C6_9HYPH|nr:hypothetical protein [Methylobacterium iners]GJD97662.1 hypothetical protein OCOJLMKI_4895 [Methylobacterium iners]